MVDDTSTGHQHRRRRKKNNARYPSPALLASLAAFIPPAVLARPVLLPFLYPSLPQSTSTSPPQQQHRPKPKRSATASSSSTPSTSRQPAASASQAESEQRRADRIAYHYKADDDGSYKPTCWSLHGQSNCPRDDPVAEPDIHEVVPGEQPDFHPTSTSTSSPSSTPTTTSPATTTSAAPASTSTVEPYTMTFEVSNIPPGWQKSGRTSFYSKNIIIGFSVTLAALICLTIVLCVIWRIRVARERRESERVLKEKKKELGIASQTSDESSLYQDQDRESTRQRGLRRRRANVRAGDEDDDDDEDGDDHDDDGGRGASHERHEPAMSERNGTSLTGRKRRTAFMRTFSGKMLTAPMKWKVKRRRQRQQEQEQQEDRMTEVGDNDNDEGEGDARLQPRRSDTTASRASAAPPPLESQNSSSRLLAQQPTTPAVETPIPASPPPPPPASLQPPSTTATPQDQAGEDDDDDDPTAIQPPAYRRRNFGIRPRVRPTAAPSTPMSPRALEKQREAEGAGVGEDVPEEYMYLAGMMPPPLRSNAATATVPARNSATLGPQRSVVGPPVEQDRDDEDEEEDAEEDGSDGEEAGETRREDVTAHLATDDKAALARLHQNTSAPSAPPALDSDDGDGQDLRPVVPAEEEIYELEGSGSSSHFPPPPSPPPPATLLPAPPAITSAHLFIPPPPPHEPSDLPQYVAGPSAPSLLGPEKLSVLPSAPEDFGAVSGPSEPPVLPSAPPAENELAATAGFVVVPSAPPMLEDGEVQQALNLAPSAPPLEDDRRAGPSAPSRAA